MKARGILSDGDLPGEPSAMSADLFHYKAKEKVGRYFPVTGDQKKNIYSVRHRGGTGTIVLGELPFSTKVLVFIENVDYTAPIWANFIAILLFFAKYWWG